MLCFKITLVGPYWKKIKRGYIHLSFRSTMLLIHIIFNSIVFVCSLLYCFVVIIITILLDVTSSSSSSSSSSSFSSSSFVLVLVRVPFFSLNFNVLIG